MFGLTFKTLDTSREYTLEELYDTIKDLEFDAGKPEFYELGLVQIIIFPPLDRYNQVHIVPAQIRKPPYSRFTISKKNEVGIKNKIENKIMAKGTRGVSSLFSFVGRNVRKAEKQVVNVYEVLEGLKL